MSTTASAEAPPTSTSRAARWTRFDTIGIVAVTALGALLRFARLTTPHRIVFDEVYYAQDGCRFVLPATTCGIRSPLSEEHPLLAKWIIAGGIKWFGYTPLGWRIFPVLAGTAAIALTYVLARRLLRSTWAASLASGLVAIDLLHLTLSRLAMLDIFVSTFALAGVLFVVLDRDRTRLRTQAGVRLRDRPWLIAAGAAFGCAVASKWSGIPFLGLAMVAVVLWDRDPRAASRSAGLVIRREWRALAIAFVVIPLVIYVVSFGNRFNGSLLALPWDRSSWWWDLAQRQWHMLDFHISLSRPSYPYTSPAWSWPLVKRPVILAFDVLADGRYRHEEAIGNPLVWWAAVAAVLACAWRWIARRMRGPGAPEGIILLGIAAGYLPWLVLTQSRSFSFLFYWLPAVPFMALALARCAQLLWRRLPGRVAVIGWLAAVLAATVFLFPIATAIPLDPLDWQARMVFRDCGAAQLEGDPAHPGHVPGPPPSGWCWI